MPQLEKEFSGGAFVCNTRPHEDGLWERLNPAAMQGDMQVLPRGSTAAAQPQERLLYLLDPTAPEPVSQLGDLRLLHANLQVLSRYAFVVLKPPADEPNGVKLSCWGVLYQHREGQPAGPHCL